MKRQQQQHAYLSQQSIIMRLLFNSWSRIIAFKLPQNNLAKKSTISKKPAYLITKNK